MLDVQKLSLRIGEVQVSTVVQCLKEWGVVDQVEAMCFDTKLSNTGHCSDACSVTELKLNVTTM